MTILTSVLCSGLPKYDPLTSGSVDSHPDSQTLRNQKRLNLSKMKSWSQMCLMQILRERTNTHYKFVNS